MEGIKQKLDILNYKGETLPSKFMVSLVMSSLDDIQKTVELLLEKGIIKLDKEKDLVLPKDYKMFVAGYEFIKDQIEKYEQIGELDALKEEPGRVLSNSALDNLNYMKKEDEPYKTPEGKYSNIPFKLSKFRSKYDQKQEDNSLYNNILDNPQSTGMDVDAYLKYEILLDHAKHLNISISGNEDVDEKVKDNITKLITGGIEDDKSILYYAMTYGRDLTEEQEAYIMRMIEEEMDYTNISDINIGRAA